MLKKIIIGVVVFIVVVSSLVGGFVFYSIKQAEKLEKEFNEVESLVPAEGNIDSASMDEINKILDRTVASGGYGKMERGLKLYLKDVITSIFKIDEILDDSKMSNILSADNIKNDGPNFDNTKQYLEKTKADLEAYKAEYQSYFEEGKVMSYLEKEDLNAFYMMLCEEVVDEMEVTKVDDDLNTSVDELNATIDTSLKVINFLSSNANRWTVEGGNIVFDTNELVNQYNILLAEFN